MGRKGYPLETKLRAKALWITGQGTDAQIAERVGIQRAETIGDWRRAENWDREKTYVEKVTEERVNHAVAETISSMNARHLKGLIQLMNNCPVGPILDDARAHHYT